MSSDPTPICAYDIYANGTSVAIIDLNAPLGDAIFRWIHFDLSAPFLPDWCKSNLSPLAVRTLLAARTRPRVDVHDDGLVLTLRGINLNEGAEVEDMVSLRVWATARQVISVRKQRIFALDDLRQQIQLGDAPPTPARLIARITESLVDRIETVSLDLEDRAEAMEQEVHDHDKLELDELAALRRSVITLRRHIGPLSDALVNLAASDSPLIQKSMRPRLRDTANRAKRSVDEVHEVADRLTTLSDHLEMLHDARLGRNSYVLSVIAAIFLPLGFLTGLFGVNVGGMPGTSYEYAFAALCAAMIVLGLLLYLILRFIKWF